MRTYNRAEADFTKLLAVIADRLYGATFLGFFAAGLFLGTFRLLTYERIAAVVVAFEIVRRCFAAEIAVNALIVHVVFAGGIFRISIRNVSHKVSYSCQSNMLSHTRDGKQSIHKELSNS
jgi:hypothetical protein